MSGQRPAETALPGERHPVPTAQEAGWVSGPVWTGKENFAPSGLRTSDRPASSQSPYRLPKIIQIVKMRSMNEYRWTDQTEGIRNILLNHIAPLWSRVRKIAKSDY